MSTAEEFLTQFVRDIIKDPMGRQQLIIERAKDLEAREHQHKLDALEDLDKQLQQMRNRMIAGDSRIKGLDQAHDYAKIVIGIQRELVSKDGEVKGESE